MSNNSYYTNLSDDTAEYVEEYRDKYDLEKSTAVRELVEKGIERDTARWPQLAIFAATVFCLVAAGTLFAASVLMAVIVSVSEVAGVTPLLVLALFGSAATAFVLAGVGFAAVRVSGLPGWLDERAAAWSRRLGVRT